jgi:predicted metallo-beta-lactamase superfamily hydrolase
MYTNKLGTKKKHPKTSGKNFGIKHIKNRIYNSMKITPLAFDSMGTRSMATLVETKDIKLIVDPGVALAPERFGLPPHPVETRRKEDHWQAITGTAKDADILIVTHYHYDHHMPDSAEIFKGKTAMLKDPKEHINKSQTARSAKFLKNMGSLPKEILYTDGKQFTYGSTKIKFSLPVTHGLENRLGYVTEVLIDDGERKFIHTSDVLGPCTDEQTDFIIKENPDTAFIDGPMYFSMEQARANLIRIIRETSIKELVIDHHLLRDPKWKEKIPEVFKEAEKKKTTRILTAAEYTGMENDLLEAKRKELYESTYTQQK